MQILDLIKLIFFRKFQKYLISKKLKKKIKYFYRNFGKHFIFKENL